MFQNIPNPFPLDVGSNATISVALPRNWGVTVTNSGRTPVNLTFDSAPFTDNSLSLNAAAGSTASKTTVNTSKKVTVGGDRTGEINITTTQP